MNSWCGKCGRGTAHDIYTRERGYLHSLCTDCGRDVVADSEVEIVKGDAFKNCPNCGTTTVHLRYRSQRGYAHWWCVSCSRDIAGDAPER